MMLDILSAALTETAQEIERESAIVPIESWSESVFRFQFCKALARAEPSIERFVECNKIDLVLRRGCELAFVEFKFYAHTRVVDPYTGVQRGWKSFPSPANYSQFKKCVEVLRERRGDSNLTRAVVLFFADPASTSRRTYASSYGVPQLADDLKIQLVLSTNPFQCRGSSATCNAMLFGVSGAS